MIANRDTLGNLHSALAEKLAERLKSGECTASDLNVIRQFLKDNNISGIPVEGSPLKNLVDELQLSSEDEAFISNAITPK